MTARASRRWPRSVAVEIGAVKDGWNGFRVLHMPASRVGALDIGFVPGEGGKTALQMASGDVDVLFSLGADEIDVESRALRRLYRHAWRCRRAPRRRHPAGRGLSGKIRHLCQHRRPRADGGARRLPARRCARGMGDPARACPSISAHGCPMTRLRNCARRCSRRFRICCGSTRSRRATPPICAGSRNWRARPTRRRSVSVIEDFYLTNPIARATAVMAECSALAERRATLTAAE